MFFFALPDIPQFLLPGAEKGHFKQARLRGIFRHPGS